MQGMEKALAASRWRTYLGHRAQVLTVVSGLLTACGFLGNIHWFLEIFSHFIAWYAVGTGILAVVLWFSGHPRWALAAAALVTIQAMLPLSWYWPAPGSGAAATSNCRLLLANVLSENTDTASFLALVERTKPDLICVQEVSRQWEESLSILDGSYPVHLSLSRGDNFGIAIYSRLPGPQPEIVFQREFGVPAMALRFTRNGREVSLLNVHTLPPAGRRYASTRNAQLDAINAWLRKRTGLAIVMGDLNTSIYSPRYRRLIRGTGAKNVRAGYGPLGTWPSWVPLLRLPLDQCLVKGDMRVVRCAVEEAGGSDHLPLLVDLAIPKS